MAWRKRISWWWTMQRTCPTEPQWMSKIVLSHQAAPCEERPDLTTVGTEAALWMMLAKSKGTKRN